MSTIRRAAGIAAVLFTTALLPSVSAAGEREQPDRREREKREAREQREAERKGWDAEGWATSEWGARERHRARRESNADDMMREVEKRMQHLHEKIHDRRMTQVEVEAELQRAQINNQGEKVVRELQRQLVEIQRELRQLELELVQHQRLYETGVERHEVMRMRERLEYVSNWGDVAFAPDRAVMMATQAIVEMCVGGEEPERAAEILGKLLDRVEQLGSRTAIRFALKDVYMVMEDPERATNEMKMVIVENASGLR
ncbi:MAG: hypothetical protein ACYTFA_13240 [Planctomycetota bacterium]